LFSLMLFFYSGSHPIEDIPIEITEFIRHLGEPAPVQPKMMKKRAESSPSTPTQNGESKGESTQSSSSSSSNGGGEAVSEDYEVSEMPILLNEVRVPFPPEARSKNIQGNVVFDILISSDGKVKDLKVVSSPDPMLTVAAQNAVSLFKFRPAKMADKPVAIRIRYTYRFLLK